MADDTDHTRDTGTPDEVIDPAEKRRRDFERSLAGPSVGKAGLVRDQTGVCKTSRFAVFRRFTDEQTSTESSQRHPRCVTRPLRLALQLRPGVQVL